MIDLNALARSTLASRARTALLALSAVGAALVAYDHRVHLIGVLPYLILLACPLMHLFMMHGHGGHSHGEQGESETSKLSPPNRDGSDA